MLYIKGKSGLCEDLGKWILENEGKVDIQSLYDLERIHNEIDEEADRELYKIADLEEYKEQIENLEDELSDTQHELKSAEDELEKFLNGAEEVKNLMRDLKELFEGDDVKISDIIGQIDNIMDEIDNRF